MTRKDELIQRADLLSRRVGGGHGGKSSILEALQQVEREAYVCGLQRASEITTEHHAKDHWYMDSMRRRIAKAIKEAQQKELG